MNAVRTAPQETPAPSFIKGLALAAATVALAMWGLGTLWLHAETSARDAELAHVLPPPVASVQ